MVSRMLQ